uniref:Enoyl reductase (ER) domain-containing protein n=1 Tax=Fusarium oxysporum (strain Fo5176) TaxID=660025 RepID=A0A0C4DIE5_FUSOF
MNTKFIAAYEPQGTTPDFRLVNGSMRAIHPSELLIRVVATGICHTDLIFATWPADQIPYPKVLGHEGQFNTFLVVSAMITELFAPLGCGFQTGAATVENVARANEKDRVAVLGLGGVGLVSIMTAKMQACRTIIGIDRVPERLELAKALGATHVINTADENIDIKDEIQRVTDGKGSSITIDTTGNMGLIKAGLEFTANRGQLIFVGVPPLDAMMDLHLVTFMQYLPRMVQWYREGKLPINKLISFYKLSWIYYNFLKLQVWLHLEMQLRVLTDQVSGGMLNIVLVKFSTTGSENMN